MGSRMEELWDSWLDSAVLWWDPEGRPATAAGPWWTWLPGRAPMHAVTAWNPGGIELGDDENDQRHGELVRWALEALGPPFARAEPGAVPDEGHDRDDGDEGEDDGEWDPPAEGWWPAVGAAMAPGPAELGLLIAGLGRADAMALGTRFGQLAIYEITDRRQEIVPCDGSATGGRAARWRDEFGALEGWGAGSWLTPAVLAPWWDRHAQALRAHGIGVAPSVRCAACGSADVGWMLWGMLSEPGPPWEVIGGCCLPLEPEDRACLACDARWGIAPDD